MTSTTFGEWTGKVRSTPSLATIRLTVNVSLIHGAEASRVGVPAAPWQPLRRTMAGADPGRVIVTPEDFRVRQYRQKREKVVIFCVDASGSAALTRLAETKGAIELMLAEAYVRREQVALIAFRGDKAEILLPPTRSLVQAKRRLAALPGGGGTPLASGLVDAAGVTLLWDWIAAMGPTCE